MSYLHRFGRRTNMRMNSPFGIVIFLVVVLFIFGLNWENYTSWFPLLFIILILGSCISSAIMRRKRAQMAPITPSPTPQTDIPTRTNPSDYYSSQTSSSYNIQYQPSQSTSTPPQQMRNSCPMCGAQLDDEILKQLIISGRAYCKFCGNQIQK